MSIFVNFSNHKSENWSENQMKAACEIGEVVDYPFPLVGSDDDEGQVGLLADQIVEKIMEFSPSGVMVQGEFTLSYAVISRLISKGVSCYAACSDRKVIETVFPDGNTKKEALFEFVRFRKY